MCPQLNGKAQILLARLLTLAEPAISKKVVNRRHIDFKLPLPIANQVTQSDKGQCLPLAGVLSPSDAAYKLGIAEETARTALKRVFRRPASHAKANSRQSWCCAKPLMPKRCNRETTMSLSVTLPGATNQQSNRSQKRGVTQADRTSFANTEEESTPGGTTWAPRSHAKYIGNNRYFRSTASLHHRGN